METGPKTLTPSHLDTVLFLVAKLVKTPKEVQNLRLVCRIARQHVEEVFLAQVEQFLRSLRLPTMENVARVTLGYHALSKAVRCESGLTVRLIELCFAVILSTSEKDRIIFAFAALSSLASSDIEAARKIDRSFRRYLTHRFTISYTQNEPFAQLCKNLLDTVNQTLGLADSTNDKSLFEDMKLVSERIPAHLPPTNSRASDKDSITIAMLACRAYKCQARVSSVRTEDDRREMMLITFQPEISEIICHLGCWASGVKLRNGLLELILYGIEGLPLLILQAAPTETLGITGWLSSKVNSVRFKVLTDFERQVHLQIRPRCYGWDASVAVEM